MLSKPIRGHPLSGGVPNWEPLLALTPGHIDDFMWMFVVGCDDASRIHAFKHCCTRRYLHLGVDGCAFVWRPANRYYEIDAHRLLALVLA